MRYHLALAALALAAAPRPAAACSVTPGYHVPTNLELVEGSDLILLGLIGEGDVDPDRPGGMRIEIHPFAVLKGELPATSITLAATIASGADLVLSNPYDLKKAHPQSFAGSCTRYAFPRGSRVLFFLDQRDGGWELAGGPFSRSAEDVLTDDAPWLQAVRFYAKVAALPAAEREAALIARHDALDARGDDPVAQLLAADIQRQLAGPNDPLREDLLLPPPEDGL